MRAQEAAGKAAPGAGGHVTFEAMMAEFLRGFAEDMYAELAEIRAALEDIARDRRQEGSVGEGVGDLWPIERYCRWFYELADGERPTKSQQVTVSRQCNNGTLPAVKVGGRWFIDMSAILSGIERG